MSILNLQSDGLHPIVLTLAGTVAREKAISRDELIRICVPQSGSTKQGDKDPAARARATLTRWISFGLFAEDGEEIRLKVDLARGESVDAFTERLPSICRTLALHPENGLPLWLPDGGVSEDGVGRTADLCRSLAWCLAQDIYELPSTYNEIDSLVTAQVQPGSFIFLNDTRWPGLRAWARFLGFATGDDSGFICDPTVAVRFEVSQMMHKDETVTAAEFLSRLAARLPVLDSGVYRLAVEQILKPEAWNTLAPGRLSTALSLALRRLQRAGALSLVTLADADSQLTLVGQGGRVWESFTHVRLSKDAL